MTHIFAILRPCNLKFGKYEVQALLYVWQPLDYVFRNDVFKRLMRVGTIFFRSEFDPFLSFWYIRYSESKRA
jgi:hypothetical protein